MNECTCDCICSSAVIKQGDALNIGVEVNLVTGCGDDAVVSQVTETDLVGAEAIIDKVEFMLGGILRWVYPDSASFDDTDDKFLLPLTQQQSFQLMPDEDAALDVRVKFKPEYTRGPIVVGLEGARPKLRVVASESMEVL